MSLRRRTLTAELAENIGPPRRLALATRIPECIGKRSADHYRDDERRNRILTATCEQETGA
jgi:hypothetical protein